MSNAAVESHHRAVREEHLMFSEGSFLPESLPARSQLQPADNLSSIFEDIHNYIYANEGLLKDRIFHEMVKLLAIKLHDEQETSTPHLSFGITRSDYENLLRHDQSSCLARLDHLLQSLRSRFPHILTDSGFNLKPLTLANVVARLQFISLQQTPRDAKGEAFQTFVYRHQRGDRGEFFTPIPIVRLAVDILSPGPRDHVIDPACGTGGFLVEALAYVTSHHPTIDRESYISEYVRGLEFNPDVALSAILRLAFEGGSGREIMCTNSLEPTPSLDGSFDLILTNPPFGSKGKVEDRSILRHFELARRWSEVRDSEWHPSSSVLPGQSPEILFIEKCLRLLRPGGRLAIVLPEGILQNVSYSHVRAWIVANSSPIAVIGIPQEAFIPYGTGIKTALLVLKKGHDHAPSSVFMARIRKVGYDVKGNPTYKAGVNGQVIRNQHGERLLDEDVSAVGEAFRKHSAGDAVPRSDDRFAIPTRVLNSRLDVDHYRPDDQILLTRLAQANSKPLASITTIVTASDPFRLEPTRQIRYIAISDVDATSMHIVSFQSLSPVEAPSRATYRVKSGDIITAIAGASTGTAHQATALISVDDEGAICSNGFAVLRDVSGVDPYYLLAFMRTEAFLSQIRRLMTGHAIPAISLADLGEVLVPIPLRAIQEQVASSMQASLAARRQAAKLASSAIASARDFLRASLE